MTDKTRVFNMDCMLGMREYPDKYFDLAIVDSPYGIGESSKNRNRITTKVKRPNGVGYGVIKTNNEIRQWDCNKPNEDYFKELQRVSKNQIIWGGNYFANLLENKSCWLVWDKCNGDSDFADCELAWTSFDSAVRQLRHLWSGMLKGKPSVTEGHKVEDNDKREKRIHRTQKPVFLYKWLLKNYAKEGDKILDTHLGSGSSRIAAFDMGFDFTGYELDKDYFDAAEKRFQQHKSQLCFDFLPGAAS